MKGPTRQHYGLATGEGLDAAPPKTSKPGYARGGKVCYSKGGGVSHASCPKGFKPMPKK